jgi:O-antigen/teichoic acid export membrane protein
MRVALWLVPVAAIIAGTAPEIVRVVFGTAFVPAGPLLTLLIGGAVASVMLMVSLTIMTAAGLPARTVMFTAPLVPLALGGHFLLIPRLGQQGAALVTVGVSLLGASAAVVGVYALWKVWPPFGSFLRSLVVALVVGVAALLWPTSGLFVFAKLIVLGMVSLLGYWWIGEFHEGEIAVVRSFLLRKTEPVRVA